MYRRVADRNAHLFVMASADPPRSELALEEYRALRATIRERSTLRLLVALITFVSWSTLALLLWRGGIAVGFGSLATLVILAAGFEAVFAIHVGVERIGRYVQSRYERPADGAPRWEHDAMAMGREVSMHAGVDPIFASLFGSATLLNLVPLVMPGIQWSVPIGPFPRGPAALLGLLALVMHGMFLWRIRQAKAFARRQRLAELAWFEQQTRTTPPS